MLRRTAVLLVTLALLLPSTALANHTPRHAFALVNDTPIFGQLGAGGSGGAFDYYRFQHPGGKQPVTVNLRVRPADAALLRGVSFNVYGAGGRLVVRGGARPGLDPNVSGDVFAEGPGAYLVQVFNYDPTRGNEYEVWATGLPAPAGSRAAPEAPIASTPYRSAAGRFQIELPEGFTTREAPGMAEFVAPDGRMRVVVTWTDLGGPPTNEQLIAHGRSVLTARYGAALIENSFGPYNDGVYFGIDFRDRSGFTGSLSLSGRGWVAYGLLLDGRTSQPELFRRLQYTFSPPSAVEPGAVLVQQDFSGGGDRPGGASNAFVEAGVVEGAYRLLFRQGGQTRHTGVSGQFGPDVTIELDVTKARGPDDATANVYCRARDSANSYELWFKPDGTYGIGKRRNGELERLTRGEAPAAIRSGGATNRVRADCVGDTLTLTVNGQRLAEVKDADYKLGGVRFGARSPEGGAGTTILVDNLIVRRA